MAAQNQLFFEPPYQPPQNPYLLRGEDRRHRQQQQAEDYPGFEPGFKYATPAGGGKTRKTKKTKKVRKQTGGFDADGNVGRERALEEEAALVAAQEEAVLAAAQRPRPPPPRGEDKRVVERRLEDFRDEVRQQQDEQYPGFNRRRQKPAGGKTRKTKKTKKVRKHQGINQSGGNKGRLKKGYRYSGKKLKSGLPQIIKIQKLKK